MDLQSAGAAAPQPRGFRRLGASQQGVGSLDLILQALGPDKEALRLLFPEVAGLVHILRYERDLALAKELVGLAREGKHVEAVRWWSEARAHPGTEIARGEATYRNEVFRCAAAAEALREKTREEASRCWRLVREGNRSHWGGTGSLMPLGLSHRLRRGDLQENLRDCEGRTCFLDEGYLAKLRPGWIGALPDWVLVRFGEGDDEPLEQVEAIVGTVDCEVALQFASAWMKRVRRFWGREGHVLEGEGFRRICGAGRGRAWVDDFLISIQATELDGQSRASISVTYLSSGGKQAEAFEGGCPLRDHSE